MKKIIITVVSIFLIALIAIIITTNLGNSKPHTDIKAAENVIFINYNAESIDKIEIYYGEDTYYISYYNKDSKKHVCVLDKDYNLIMTVENEKLKTIDEIKNDEYKIGYKYEKLVYEIKKENKDGYTYSYYDVLTGEFIKKINVDR
ncbi:MAG: hypothetical protein E7166_01610 [Firmicutes bacterium]|nr:hypothetical protein [Bacillota bacterium]